MVYDDDASSKSTNVSQQMTPAPTSVEVKNVINTGEAVSTAPVVSEAPKMQKASEKSREKRVFQESTNNELVVQKLEERRLKQEEKLTAEINKRFTIEQEEAAGTAAPVMKEEKVVKPIQDAPGSDSYQMSAAPKAEAAVIQPIQSDRVAIYQSSAMMSPAPTQGMSATTSESTKSKAGVSVIPRAGLATLTNSAFNMSPKYMMGVGLGFDVSDHVGVELGYSYSEIGVRYTDAYTYGGYYAPVNELNFKNNTFDVAAKFFFTDLEAKVRPYIGGGMAYSTGSINYDERYQQMWATTYQWYRASDYTLNQFQGLAQAGMDLRVAPNITIGAAYKFLKPISSNESEEGLGYGYFYGQPVDPAKQAFRGQIRDSNTSIYQISASVTF
jgi:outer membrane protein W